MSTKSDSGGCGGLIGLIIILSFFPGIRSCVKDKLQLIGLINIEVKDGSVKVEAGDIKVALNVSTQAPASMPVVSDEYIISLDAREAAKRQEDLDKAIKSTDPELRGSEWGDKKSDW